MLREQHGGQHPLGLVVARGSGHGGANDVFSLSGQRGVGVNTGQAQQHGCQGHTGARFAGVGREGVPER